MEPLVSIIMPAFNEECYIEESINSVLGQSYGNWELLVVDDGSQDNTRDVVWGFDDSRISLYAQTENLGVSAARNVGLKHSRGEYITFLDADDVLTPESIRSRLDILSFNPKVGFADGKVVTFNSRMTTELGVWTPDYHGPPFQRLITLDGSCFYGLTWLIRKEGLSEVTFSNAMTHGEDLLYLMRLSYHSGYQYAFTDQEILHRRTGHGSAMHDLSGLEDGYKELCFRLGDFNDVSEEQASLFKRRARSIMIKSYLGQLDLKQAIRMLGSKW